MAKVDTEAWIKKELLTTFDPKKQESVSSGPALLKRSTLLAQLYPGIEDHNERIRRMDQDNPGWRGYDNPI